MGILGILIGIVLVVVLTYRGLNVIIAAPICAVIVILFNYNADPAFNFTLVSAFTSRFLPGSGNFITSMIAFYLAGGILGAVYSKSGAARSVGITVINIIRGNDSNKKVSPFAAVMIVSIAAFILAYGGVHVVALIFIMIPLTIEVLKAAGIPIRMAPGLVMAAVASYALCAPGSPQTQNAWATALRTNPNPELVKLAGDSFDALIPGIIGTVLTAILNIAYLTWAAKKEIEKGPDDGESKAQGTSLSTEGLPNPIVSLIPLVALFVVFNVFKVYLPFAVFIGIVLGLILFARQLGIKNIPKIIGEGCANSCIPLIAGAVMGGFGTVVAGSPGFLPIRDGLASFAGPPLLMVTIAFIVITAVCGSGPAALGAGYPVFGPLFVNQGVSPAAIHRISSFAAVTFDTLPTNAVFLASTSLTGYAVKDTYKHVGVCTVVNTTIGTFIVMILCMIMGV
jgi:H+/gluconate symporter-like permease